MGLTSKSVGIKAVDMGFSVKKISDSDKVIALAGNPNVGKSTVFNELTGLRQHTGNWPGKTVSNAQGIYTKGKQNYVMVDIPGTYSLMAHSTEEEVARDFICFGDPDAVIVVCDATCLERNMNLVLQTIEITKNVVVCVNLIDEAQRKNISINLKELSKRLGVRVVGASARNGKGLKTLMEQTEKMLFSKNENDIVKIEYDGCIERAIKEVEDALEEKLANVKLSLRWTAIRLIESDKKLLESINKYVGFNLTEDKKTGFAVNRARQILEENKIDKEGFKDKIVSAIVKKAEKICDGVVVYENGSYNAADRKIDAVLTNRITGIPIMIALLCVVFWITITGANIPSKLLSDALFSIEDMLVSLCIRFGVSERIYSALIFGVYRVVAWVVSVMLPPMAIFFPMFTILEDLGYLPRVAFNLDKTFIKCCACGKQALTMCMGFGCNAAGIVGCRIIDSPRERLIAMITNNFVPCNGRFPTLISIITMFFVFTASAPVKSFLGTLILTAVVMLGIFMTFAVSKLLSKTILKGQPSSFTLELPPYRIPKIGRVIVRSIFDRTLFVLGRAVSAAAPAGLIIWICANVSVGDVTILNHLSGFLDPFAQLIGLDGIILLAFILGFPANEIVVPIIIMAYMSSGSIAELDNLQLRELLMENGWTWITAVSTMLFSLFHWPCSTTMLTIKKETGSLKWTAVAFIIPTVTAVLVCFVFTTVARLFV